MSRNNQVSPKFEQSYEQTKNELDVNKFVMNSGLNRFISKDTNNLEIENFELVIEGEALSIMLKGDNREILKQILVKTSAVLVCRSSPKQKAEVVGLGKEINPNQISLAIGDGGNDVIMIKKADVGVGIFGKEGYQAVTASDYAICEFQFLKRLLFIHGRNNTHRMNIFLTHFLIKNAIFCLPSFLYGIYSFFTGVTFYEPGYQTNYNIIFTNLALLYYAIYETDVNPNLQNAIQKAYLPNLYSETRGKDSFNMKRFGVWYLYGVYGGFMIFFINYYCYLMTLNSNGKTFGHWQISFTLYTSIYGINMVIVGSYIRTWSWFTFFFFFLNIFCYYPCYVLIYNFFPQNYVRYNHIDLYSYIHFWLIGLLLIALISTPFLIFRKIQLTFFPYLIDLVMTNKVPIDEHKENNE